MRDDKMPRNVYVAAPWVHKDLAAAFAARLEDRGLEITHKWWLETAEGAEIDTENPRELGLLAACAERDMNAVFEADAVIVLNVAKSEGKAVELGMALAWSIPVCVVGKPRLNIFQTLPAVTVVEDTEGVWGWLQEVL